MNTIHAVILNDIREVAEPTYCSDVAIDVISDDKITRCECMYAFTHDGLSRYIKIYVILSDNSMIIMARHIKINVEYTAYTHIRDYFDDIVNRQI